MVATDIFVILVPALPLIGFLLISLNLNRISHGLVAVLSPGVVLLSFAISIYLFVTLLGLPVEERAIEVEVARWFSAGDFSVDIRFLIDPLSIIMLMIITGVGFLIHVYSIGYMHEDAGFNRFFSYLNLFVFFMLLLVMGANYLMMFVGWEGVGLCSYLLIGFWFKNDSYNKAANKAFIMNRIGDLGLLLGMILIYIHFGSLDYSEVFPKAAGLNVDTVTLITLLLFVGAMGKSAQIPLFTWLPDAMAGPTPVSALIHAATMVTAGVYMVVRNNVLYSLSPAALQVILFVGLATALVSALIAISQNDIKKVLAYSTVSQLGLMFVALGVGAFSTGIFHMATHAFFKALLFLGAGSVIHALSGEQDLRKMGGLRKHLPITHFTFLTAVLAISGIPPFAGFFSKDEILAHAFASNPVAWGAALLTSLLTVFYMFRLYFLAFYGNERAGAERMAHIHESPASITIPLMILAVLSFAGGWMNIPGSLGGGSSLHAFLEPVIATTPVAGHVLSHATEYMLMGIVVALTVIVIFIALRSYVSLKAVPADESRKLSATHQLSYRKFYFDELYEATIVKPTFFLAGAMENVIERLGIDRLVNAMGEAVVKGSSILRLLQFGRVGLYLLVMVVGIVLILTWSLITQ